MAKGKYYEYVEPKLDVIEGWCRNGLTIEQVAHNLGISKVTLYKYMGEHIELSERLKKGKEVIDLEVENALLKRALGYEYEEVKTYIEEDKNGNKKKRIEKTKKVLPADTTAQIFWLKNRKVGTWSDKKEETLEEKQLIIENKKLINKKLEAETRQLLDRENIVTDDKPFELPAKLIAPSFASTVFDIEDKLHKEYVLHGGRGSTKSSFVGLEIINLIKKNPTMHALACRKVENTLRDSVYNQIKWAIGALGLENEFYTKLSPLEIEYLPTGQKIYFRGCDDPTKIKSIKPSFGYIGILWLEELDQFNGAEQVRSIEQSAIRGGDDAFIFKTFNPPKTANNWANKYIKIPKENQFQLHNDYLSVPSKWLGKTFIEEAEHLKSVNPTAYEHEYMGVANGNGGNVFDNVEIRTITDEEISQFDRLYYGVDFGWYPDVWAFAKVHYDAARRTLYILEESRENKKSNKETYDIMVNKHHIKPNDKIICDSAEPKSIEDYRSYGLFARGAIKGPGSVDYSMKWLQSLNKIVIDNARTPGTATEFLDYEYERDKNGEVITGYPDKNNHSIDCIRYALNDVWKRKGM